jgi:uncharacterized protein YndB with AHSA1/START domain
MAHGASDKLSVVIERDLPYPPEKVWRALTQPLLLAQWLMKNDFEPQVGHRFNFRADWGVVDAEVLASEPDKTLSYTWNSMGLKSVVTWTLAPAGGGTRLRMEQSGFPAQAPQYYEGAKQGWQQFFAAMAQVLARTD